MTSLSQWAASRRELDDCPWPGPRPLTQDENDAFVGREDDVSEFLTRVRQNRLVVLTGESGVGKSSLLNAKLIPTQKRRGRRPVVCKQWPSPSKADVDADEYLKEVIRNEPLNDDSEDNFTISEDDLRPLGVILDEELGQTGLLILDQFEEFIRYQPEMFTRVANWIVNASRRHHAKIVISLRSEYLHRLRMIETQAPTFGYSMMYLDPVTDIESVRRIIRDTPGDKAGKPVDDAAVELLVRYWPDESTSDVDDWIKARTGLLHLQATLYALYSRAQTDAEDRCAPLITPSIVEAFVTEAKRASDELESHGYLFGYGLRKAVELKLNRCRDACKDVALDNTLVEGAMAAAYRMFPHLSSGGFKSDRAALDLAELALDRSIEQLSSGRTRSEMAGLVRDVFDELWSLVGTKDGDGTNSDVDDTTKVGADVDLLTASRRLIAERVGREDFCVDQELGDENGRGYDVKPWESDPRNVSSGPLMGFSPADVLIEELRRVVFAQHWLEETQLVRSSSRDSRKFITLVHDRVGQALELWARSDTIGSRDAPYLLTAAKGRTFRWVNDDREDGDKVIGPRTQWLNLRWRECEVSATFEDVVFVNCDFTGTRFTQCIFKGVTFVNCILDNAMFDSCEIVGKVKPLRTSTDDLAMSSGGFGAQASTIYEMDLSRIATELELREGRPSFVVEVDAAKVAELAAYRTVQSENGGKTVNAVFSKTSGVGAMPWREDYQALLYFPREAGGLAMYGGRLSSLMIRACSFVEDGQLALRFVAGSTLDIVESRGCDVEIAHSSVRGLSITRPVGSPDAEGDHQVTVNVRSTYFTNAWIGHGLTGAATFDNCIVCQLLSLSDPEAFSVRLINDSLGVGVVGEVELLGNSLINENPSRWLETQREPDSNDKDDKERLIDKMLQVDYRSDPAGHVLSRKGNVKH